MEGARETIFSESYQDRTVDAHNHHRFNKKVELQLGTSVQEPLAHGIFRDRAPGIEGRRDLAHNTEERGTYNVTGSTKKMNQDSDQFKTECYEVKENVKDRKLAATKKTYDLVGTDILH